MGSNASALYLIKLSLIDFPLPGSAGAVLFAKGPLPAYKVGEELELPFSFRSVVARMALDALCGRGLAVKEKVEGSYLPVYRLLEVNDV